MLIVCRRCFVSKPANEFYGYKKKDGTRAPGWKCKQCHRKVIDGWRRRNPDKVFGYNHRPGAQTVAQRKHRYRITKSEFDHLLQLQNFECAICFKTFDKTKNTCIDHDHITGKIRGILCRKCNAGIGQLGDDLKIVKNALFYLEKTRGNSNA